MKKELRCKKDESIDAWVNRIADYWNFGKELRETLVEIKAVSYIVGVNDGLEQSKKNEK